MIIPIKCFSCGKVLADKYRHYLKRVEEERAKQVKANTTAGNTRESSEYLSKESIQHKSKTAECTVLNEMGVKNACCRQLMLTHVDIF